MEKLKKTLVLNAYSNGTIGFNTLACRTLPRKIRVYTGRDDFYLSVYPRTTNKRHLLPAGRYFLVPHKDGFLLAPASPDVLLGKISFKPPQGKAVVGKARILKDGGRLAFSGSDRFLLSDGADFYSDGEYLYIGPGERHLTHGPRETYLSDLTLLSWLADNYGRNVYLHEGLRGFYPISIGE